MTDDELEPQPVRPLTPRRITPGRPPRMAKPIPGRLTEVQPEPPPARPTEPLFDLTPDEPYDEPSIAVESEAPQQPPPPQPEELTESESEAAAPELESAATEPGPAANEAEPDAPQAEPEAAEPEAVASDAVASEPDLPMTVRETLSRVDEAWRSFHAAAARFPSERMDERLTEDGWTRKQMLAHIAAWHDLTADRLVKFFNTGQPPEFDQDPDQFNATVARRAIGKTAGEVLNDTEATFNRLRRQMQRLTDSQLRQFEHWAAWVIHGNTYGHYDEHRADVYLPEPPPGSARR